MKLTPGKHPAKIKSYGVGKPQGKSPMPPVYVEFEIVDPGTGEVATIYWFGNMGQKTNPEAKMHPYEVSINNLVTMGLKGSDPYAIAENSPGALNTFKEYELVLENNVHDGKTSLRVKYINVPGSGGMKETLSAAEARATAGFNFAGAVLAAKQAAGVKDEPTGGPTQEQIDEDIPF